VADELSQELADLTADFKALILDARSRGVDAFPVFTGERVPLEPPAPAAVKAEVARPVRTARTVERPSAARPSAVPGAESAKSQPEAPAPAAPIVRSAVYGTDSEALFALRNELGACERCGLCKGRSQLVFGTGDAEADLMIIGDAPGAQEDRKGLPFVGPIGQMLDNMLKHVLGLERESVYISNVVKCRPPNNRAPEPEETATCRPFLMRQIDAVKPKVILSLGSPAAQTLLGGTASIGSLRGQWHEVNGIPVLPTFHPAYLLRKPEDKRLVFQDLKALNIRYDELGGQRS